MKNYVAPGGMHVRVDSGLYTGYRVPPYYDSMIGKLIVYGTTRERCIMRLRRALEEFVVEGMKTTVPLHQKIVRDPEFLAGDYTIKWLERWLEKQATSLICAADCLGGQAPLIGTHGQEFGLDAALDHAAAGSTGAAVLEARAAPEFRALADNIPTLCWMACADGDIYWYNAPLVRIYRHRPDDQEAWGWESSTTQRCCPRSSSDGRTRWRPAPRSR